MIARTGHRHPRVWPGDLTCAEVLGSIPRVAVVLERKRRRPVGPDGSLKSPIERATCTPGVPEPVKTGLSKSAFRHMREVSVL